MKLLLDQNLSRRIIEQIEVAFPATVPTLPLINHECEECIELQSAFAGRSWKEVSPELIKKHFSNLSLFSPRAFHAFIPAYLTHSIKNFNDDDLVSEFTAYAFLPDKLASTDEGHANFWKLKLSLFTDEQFNIFLDYLDLVEANDQYFDRSLLERSRKRFMQLRVESSLQ